MGAMFFGCSSGVSAYKKKPKKKKKKCDCPSWSLNESPNSIHTFNESLATTSFKPYFCNLESI